MNNFHKQIRGWIDLACDSNDVPELKHKIDFEFNGRFTRRLGDAIYNRRKGRGFIRLSAPLWPRATEEERRETVIHEACHVVVGYKYQNQKVVDAHGGEWRSAMNLCGLEPLRTHRVDRTGIARRQTVWLVTACPKSPPDNKCIVNNNTFKQVLKQNQCLHCVLCGLNVDFHMVEKRDDEE